MIVHVECDFCGADDTALLFQTTDTNYHFEGIFNIVQCRRCGLTYLNPRPDEDTISLYYPETDYTCFRTIEEPSGFSQKDTFVRLLSELGTDIGYLCDIGCGVGDFLVAAQRSGWKVAGVEINDYVRKLCNERLGEKAVLSSLEKARFPSKTFDVVTLWHVLEHLPSPRRTLAEIHRILKKGGLVALAVPNFDSLGRRIWGAKWIPVDAPRHFFHFTRATLIQYVETYGFEVVCVYQQPGANSLASNVLRTLRILFLDPSTKKDSHLDTAHNVESCAKSPKRHNASYYKVGQQTKDRVRKVTTKFVSPVAWVIAKLGLGPELVLYARKVERAS
jgi:SAM-dependent methyltransferase